MARFLKLLILVPVAILIVLFAVANRQTISVSFDPFNAPSVSTAVVAAPLFVLLFIVLLVGVFIGGVASWVSQGANRRRTRIAEDEAEQWRDEVRRMREQAPLVRTAPAPAGPASTATIANAGALPRPSY